MTTPDDPLRAMWARRQACNQDALLRVFGDPQAEELLAAAVADYVGSPAYEQHEMAEGERLLADAVTDMEHDNDNEEGTTTDYGNDEDSSDGPDAA